MSDDPGGRDDPPDDPPPDDPPPDDSTPDGGTNPGDAGSGGDVDPSPETGYGGGARREGEGPGTPPGSPTERGRFGIRGLAPEERYVGGLLVALAVLLGLLVAVGFLDPRYLLYLLSLAGVYVLLSMGLNVQWGYSGLINFSVAAFFGIGAYGVALSTGNASPIAGGYSPAVGIVVGLVAAGVLALLIGLPTLSLSEDYLAIATLGLAEVVRLVIRTEDQWTNGSAGLYGIPTVYTNWPVVGELTGRFERAAINFAVVLVVVVAVWLLLRRIHTSPWGRVQRLVRTDPDLAEALGKDTYRLRLQSFVIGGLVMALAGALYAHVILFVGPNLLSPIQTFYVWIAVIIGGTGSDRGAIFGGLLVIAIVEGTRFVSDATGPVVLGPVRLLVEAGPLRLFTIGTLILLVIHFRPEGVLPPRRELIWPGADGGGRDE